MSGWIKWEKDLENDPRFKRMVNGLMKARGIDPCNATPYHVAQHVTVVSGALLRMWSHADTYVREDDTLDMTTEELNSYLGVAEFSRVCCADWLGETDDGRVYLPGFLDKNGPEAKEKAQTAKRVARHRAKKRLTVTSNTSNGTALPDQTRPDQTRPHSQSESACDPPNKRQRSEGREGKDSAVATLEQVTQLKAAYPKGIYRQSEWLVAERCVNHHLESGAAFAELLAGCERYAAQCRARGSTGTQYVLSPVKFFDREHPEFSEPFPLPESEQANGTHPPITWRPPPDDEEPTRASG